MTRLARDGSGATGAFLAFATSGAALAALLANAGAFERHLDILAHLAPGYAAIGLAGLVAGAFVRGRRPVVLAASLLAIAASAALMVPEITGDAGPEATSDAPGQIKVIQVKTTPSAHVRQLAAWLIAQKPDVVTVTDAGEDLRALLVAGAGWKMAGARGSLIVFTREHYLVMNRPRMAPAETPWFVNATYATPGGPMEVVTAHLGWPTNAQVASKARGLANIMARLSQPRTILAGDLNATPWSAELRRLDRASGLIRRDRAVPTYPAQVLGRPWPWPFLPIDHVYAGPGWATVKVERGPGFGLDHYPLVVTLAPVAPR